MGSLVLSSFFRLGDKIWEWPGDEAIFISGQDLVEEDGFDGEHTSEQALEKYAQSLPYYAMPALLAKSSYYAQYYASQLDCVVYTNAQYVC